MHGLNGMNPKYTIHLWNTVVLPCLLNGTEIWNLTTAEIEPLELFQRKVLKQLQGLPDSTATAAVCLLSGVLPVEARIHARALTYYRSMVADRSSREYRLAQQQLSLKQEGSSSWFLYVEDIAHKYGLPNPHDILAHPPSKDGWKQTVKETIWRHWRGRIESDAATKSTLKNMHQVMRPGKVADIWEASSGGLTDTARAHTKARLLTGTYRLQSVVGRQNKMDPDKTCKLCREGVEDLKHFLLCCPSTETERSRYLKKIEDLMQKMRPEVTNYSPEILVQTILDSRKLQSEGQVSVSVQAQLVSSVERSSRDMIEALHRSRWVQLERLAKL